MNPTWLISGQSVCSGCGFEDMSYWLPELLTNVTRVPGLTVTVDGEIRPSAPMVIVVDDVPLVPPPPVVPPPLVAPPPADGDVGLSPPEQASAVMASVAARTPAMAQVRVVVRVLRMGPQ